jgi:hypothetical protein
LISADADGLQSHTRKMVRSQVTPTMTFAEVQILAEQVGAAGRALNSSNGHCNARPLSDMSPEYWVYRVEGAMHLLFEHKKSPSVLRLASSKRRDADISKALKAEQTIIDYMRNRLHLLEEVTQMWPFS